MYFVLSNLLIPKEKQNIICLSLSNIFGTCDILGSRRLRLLFCYTIKPFIRFVGWKPEDILQTWIFECSLFNYWDCVLHDDTVFYVTLYALFKYVNEYRQYCVVIGSLLLINHKNCRPTFYCIVYCAAVT